MRESSEDDGEGASTSAFRLDDSLFKLRRRLDLSSRREREMNDEEDDDLRAAHEAFFDVLRRELDEKKRRRLHEMLLEANLFREQVFYLRRLPRLQKAADRYYRQTMASLHVVVERTFDASYRQAGILVGLVECCAELLVLEVLQWGPAASLSDAHLNSTTKRNERRDIRKMIASVLTNLTFGSIDCKELLCFYDGFLPAVVSLLGEATNLIQPFCNLLRNMSWQAKPSMMCSLSALTAPLARSVIHSFYSEEERSVRSALAALWNTMAYSEDSMAAVCDDEEFLSVLPHLLASHASRATIVEYASGILKYVCRHLVTPKRLHSQRHATQRRELASALLPLLRAGSIVIVKNSIGALSELFRGDAPNITGMVSRKMHEELKQLSASQLEEVRQPVTLILARINQYPPSSRSSHGGSVYHGYDMSVSTSSATSRLFPRRPSRRPSPIEDASPSARSLSLPRPLNGHLPHAANGEPAPGTSLFTASSHPFAALAFAPPPSDRCAFVKKEEEKMERDTGVDERVREDESAQTGVDEREREDESAQPTRHTSVSSLSSLLLDHPSGLESTLDSAVASGHLSPVSYSDLPDSPTQILPMKSAAADSAESLPSSSRTASDHTSSTPRVPLSVPSVPELRKAPVSTLSQEFNRLVLVKEPAQPVESEIEDDYSTLDGGNEFLDRSIEEAWPQSNRPATASTMAAEAADSDLLSTAIQSAMPGLSSPGYESPFGKTPKNEDARCGGPSGEGARTEGLLLSSDSEQEAVDSLVGVVPVDVSEEAAADDITIDCSRVDPPKHKNASRRPSGVPRLARGVTYIPPNSSPLKGLRQPSSIKTPYKVTESGSGRGLQFSSPRPSSHVVPSRRPKPSSTVVSPFNYVSPSTRRWNGRDKEGEEKDSAQASHFLVTTL